jgi:hypothetical protein
MTAEQILRIHTDIFNRALKEQDYAALEGLYASDYMLVRPDGSVLNKQEVLQDLRSGGLRFHSIELGQTEVRMYGSTAVLTAESQAVSSRNGVESRSHFRLIAVYVQQGQSIIYRVLRRNLPRIKDEASRRARCIRRPSFSRLCFRRKSGAACIASRAID